MHEGNYTTTYHAVIKIAFLRYRFMNFGDTALFKSETEPDNSLFRFLTPEPPAAMTCKSILCFWPWG